MFGRDQGSTWDSPGKGRTMPDKKRMGLGQLLGLTNRWRGWGNAYTAAGEGDVRSSDQAAE